jgi:hypothetical protein
MAFTVVLRVLLRLSSRISVKFSTGSTGLIEALLPSSESKSESYVALSLCCQLTFGNIPPVYSRHDCDWARDTLAARYRWVNGSGIIDFGETSAISHLAGQVN